MPSSTYLPEVGVSRNPSIFMKVDFPEPEAPIMEMNSPLFMERETPFNACTLTSSLIWYILKRSVISMRLFAILIDLVFYFYFLSKPYKYFITRFKVLRGNFRVKVTGKTGFDFNMLNR